MPLRADGAPRHHPPAGRKEQGQAMWRTHPFPTLNCVGTFEPPKWKKRETPSCGRRKPVGDLCHSGPSILQRAPREDADWISLGTKNSSAQPASLVACRVFVHFLSCVNRYENPSFCKRKKKTTFLRFLSDKLYCILQCHLM